MKINDVMTTEVLTLAPDATLADAARLMWEHDCGFLPVIEPQTRALLGVVTDRDAFMAAYTQGAALNALGIEPAMAKTIFSCRPDDDVVRAHELLRRHQLRRLPVVDAAGHLVGVVSVSDLARTALRENPNVRPHAFAEVNQTLVAIGKPRALAATA